MKTRQLSMVMGLIAAVCVGVAMLVRAQGGAPAASSANNECAMIKWDGPDKLAIIYPDRVEAIRVFKSAKLPSDVTEEEFCLTWGANKLAKEGWQPVNLNSRRILFRRSTGSH